MRRAHFFAFVVAALMAGTTWASAQGFVDDPPGWAFQKRGIIESNGESPFDYYGSRRHFAWHYRHWRGPYSWAYVHHPRYRHYWRHW